MYSRYPVPSPPGPLSAWEQLRRAAAHAGYHLGPPLAPCMLSIGQARPRDLYRETALRSARFYRKGMDLGGVAGPGLWRCRRLLGEPGEAHLPGTLKKKKKKRALSTAQSKTLSEEADY